MAVVDPITEKTKPRQRFAVANGSSYSPDSDEHDDEEFYPSSDGKPMAETIEHRDLIFYATAALNAFFAKTPDVWVSGNDFIYYEEGNPRARVSPDCYVVFNVPRRERSSFRTWEDGGRAPRIVFEFTSTKTRKEDLTSKRELYQDILRVPEYFLFDPSVRPYLKPRLQGYRLQNGVYVPLELAGGDRLHSEQLGLDIVVQGTRMRFFDPVSGNYLYDYQEVQAQREEEAARVREERQRADAAEAEVARLRAEIEALRRERRDV